MEITNAFILAKWIPFLRYIYNTFYIQQTLILSIAIYRNEQNQLKYLKKLCTSKYLIPTLLLWFLDHFKAFITTHFYYTPPKDVRKNAGMATWRIDYVHGNKCAFSTVRLFGIFSTPKSDAHAKFLHSLLTWEKRQVTEIFTIDYTWVLRCYFPINNS